MKNNKRNLIFISHATPEDNTFTLWLSARLKILGYEVWSDVTKLFGGEKWWTDIEEAVDEYTCKFILVITKTSLSKPGVKREVELALLAEAKHGLPNFIIPIIIDDSSFGGQPYGLSERNIISFSNGWGHGLSRLLERLNRDGIPNQSVGDNLGIAISKLANPAFQVVQQKDVVVSNWLTIESIPSHLFFYRLPIKSKDFNNSFASFPYPWFEWGDMLVTFTEANTLKKFLPPFTSPTAAPRLELAAVIENRPRNHSLFLRIEVIKKMNYVLSTAWNAHMQELGLAQYGLSNGKIAWFFPDTEDFFGKKEFADVYGVVRKKQVVGFSPKNSVYWHYAVEIKPLYGAQPKLCLIPHVVFTEDGKAPLSDKKKMHRLRRGFCKNWWNPRWRDMLLVYLNIIAQGKGLIEINLDENSSLTISSRPIFLQTEVSLKGIDGTDEQDDDSDVAVPVDLDESDYDE